MYFENLYRQLRNDSSSIFVITEEKKERESERDPRFSPWIFLFGYNHPNIIHIRLFVVHFA